jgi:cation transport regulator ChaC
MKDAISTNRLPIFAYGSLLFRPGFAYLARQRAELNGYARSFSQASPDHRGTPERPGRVVTLWPRAEATLVGAVYYVTAPASELLRELDYRERAGYERVLVEVVTETERLQAVTWIAPPGNAYDVGQLPLVELAQHVQSSVGPSGRNDDYVFQLERALAELGGVDEFVSALSALLQR